jgi:hypothetical protein
MADSRYGPSVSNSQSALESSQLNSEERARITAELDNLSRAIQGAQSAAGKLHNLANAIILKSKSAPGENCGPHARFNSVRMSDQVDELRRFLNCAYLGADALRDDRERDAIQAVMAHVIHGLDHLSEDLHPRSSSEEAQAA